MSSFQRSRLKWWSFPASVAGVVFLGGLGLVGQEGTTGSGKGTAGSGATGQVESVEKPERKSTAGTRRYGLKLPPANFSPPGLSIAEPVYSWGAVLQGEVVVREFKLKNTGGSPLRIERVKPSCGCTAVDYDQVILPGAVGTVTLKVDTKKFSGSVTKTAEVSTNIGRTPERLTMTGQIDPAVVVEPKLPRMEVVPGVPVEPLKVTLQRASAQHPIRVTEVSTKSDVIDATLKEVQAGELYEIEVTPKISEGSRPYHYAQVSAQVDVDGKSFEFPVNVSITVKNRIEATPSSVYFSRRDTDSLRETGGEPPAKSVEIRSLVPNHSFRITDVEVQGVFFQTRLETVQEGKQYRLQVVLPELPPEDKRRVVEKILVRTDDPELSELRITATASVGTVARRSPRAVPLPTPGARAPSPSPQPGQKGALRTFRKAPEAAGGKQPAKGSVEE